jgi:hypothetical protein
LIGTDASGELSLNSSFALSNINFATAPNLSILTTALQEAGSVAGPDTLVLKPGNEFSFTIPKSVFVSPSDPPISQFYSLLSSHTPLPNWISFNTDTFTFSGTTPSITSTIAPSETYSALLFAIQVPGFSSANLAFNMVVGPHQFSTNILSVNQTLVRGEDFIYELPLNDILLDGGPVNTSDISNVQTNSSWISSNITSLSGKVPENFANSTYSLKITNKFADSVEIQLNLFTHENSLNASSTALVFTESKLPELNATAGEFFTFTIPTSVINSSSSTDNIDLQTSPNASWLEFHSTNMTLNGLVPEYFEKTQITLVNNNNNDDKLVFSLSPTEKLNGASTPSPTANETSGSVSKSPSKKTVAIVCGVVIPVAAIIIALLLFFCFCRHRRNNPSIIRARGLRGKISRPIITSYSEKAPNFTRKMSDLPITPNSQTNFYTTSTEKLHDPYDSFVTDEFDSPGGATKFNMDRLDNPKSAPFVDFQGSPRSFFSDESDDTHIDKDAQIEAMQRNIMQQLEKTNPTPTSPAPAVINKSVKSHSPILVSPLRAEFIGTDDNDVVISKPQNSWRRSSQPNQRWHARGQGGSLATIASGDLPSVRMIDHTALPEMTDEDGSPVVRPVSDSSDFSGSSHYSESPSSKHTSNSASIGSYSSSEMGSDNNNFGPTVPYSNNVNAIVELPQTSFQAPISHASTACKHTEETSETDNVYRTASSGDEYMDAESSGDEGDVLKPYINAQGQWEWGTISYSGPTVYGQALDHPFQRTSAYSDVGTITNVSPFVRDEHAMSSATLRRTESTKLVSFTKERSASIITTNHTQTSVGSVMQGESAEFSYMP